MFEVDLEKASKEEIEEAKTQKKKIGKIGELDVEALNKARLEGKKIGLVQGSWDQFHYGHLRYIKKAKENCDYLIVGLDSDAKIQKRKGKNRPLIPEDERYAMIKELLLILHRFNLITMNLVTNRNINPNYYNNEKV